MSMAEKLLMKIKQGENEITNSAPSEKKPLTVLPYLHKILHNLNKLGNNVNVRVGSSPQRNYQGYVSV